MKFLPCCLLLATLAPVSVSWAGDCASDTQQGMNQCADVAYKKSDAELNRVYQQIRTRLKQSNKSLVALVSAQKHWIAFRDAECTFRSSASVGGTVYPLLVLQCRDALTRQRIEQLTGYLHCQEGDMSCPVPTR